MLPIILFILGLYYLHVRQNYAVTMTIIIVLCTSFLQLQITNEFIRPHSFNTSDVGVLLYVLFHHKVKKKYGTPKFGTLQKIATVYFAFLFINGLYELQSGTSFKDVISYLKNQIPLLFVYIYPNIRLQDGIKSFKHIYYLTIVFCAIVTLLSLTGFDAGIFNFMEERGVKPPPNCMYFAAMSVMGVISISKMNRWLHSFIFIVPVIISMKMTYAISIVLIITLMNLLTSSKLLINRLFIIAVLSTVGFLVIRNNAEFSKRFDDMVAQAEEINTNDDESSGNFSYRILHASERLNYICQKPFTIIRGIGYVSEKNYTGHRFTFGTGGEAQLDTGDIAWSLFFIRLGLFGTFLYLVVYLNVARQYWKNRQSQVSVFFFSMLMVYLLFTSIGNCLIVYADFLFYPLIFLNSTKLTYRLNQI